MCSVLLLRHHEARKHATAAPCFIKLELRKEAPERRQRAAKSRSSELVMLLALAALVFLARGAMAQAQENSAPILSSGLRERTPLQTQSIEKLGKRPATEPLFDAAKLSPTESIGAESDIRPFLAPDAPTDLTRAALRRAWSTDPAIRDFIGLSDNSWDFNAPGGVPGFGPLTGDDARLLARAMKERENLDSGRLAVERSTDDRVPVLTGEATQAPSSAQVK